MCVCVCACACTPTPTIGSWFLVVNVTYIECKTQKAERMSDELSLVSRQKELGAKFVLKQPTTKRAELNRAEQVDE